MTVNEARHLWDAWLEDVATNRVDLARARAERILELLDQDLEPRWLPAERHAFLNWCVREGLTRKAG